MTARTRTSTKTPPPIPDEPYATIRVETGGTFFISWGLGWIGKGSASRRSVRRAVKLRERKLRKMQELHARTQVAAAALEAVTR